MASKITKCGEYRYSTAIMRRIQACAYLALASKPELADHALAHGVCVGHNAIRYVIGAVHRLMDREYADTFAGALALYESSQVTDQWRRWGKVIRQLSEDYVSPNPAGTDIGALQRELIKWRESHGNAARDRIAEIAVSTGELTEPQTHAVKYLLRTSRYRGIVTPRELVYLIRNYLGPDAAA